MAEVDILMATFNGAEYIEQQIRSILNQTYTSWRLLVHDDGSTDGTNEIVARFSQEDHRIVILNDNAINLGACRNFLHILPHSSAPFIMLCDQDDIWLPRKVEEMVAAIAVVSGPALVYCDGYPLKNDSPIKESIVLHRRENLKDTLFLNGGIHGCLMILNKQLKEKIFPYPEYVCMHDYLLTLAALTFGKVHYINSVLIYYRQHDANATGNYETNFLRRCKNFFFMKRSSVLDLNHYNTTKSFVSRYSRILKETDIKLFEGYFNYAESKNKFHQIFLVLKHKFRIGNSMGILLLKTILRKTLNYS